MRIWPSRPGLEYYKGIGNAWRHRISRNLGGSYLGKDVIHLRKFFYLLLKDVLHFHCLRQACSWDAKRVDRQITFVQTWYKLTSHPCCQKPTKDNKRTRCRNNNYSVMHGQIQDGGI